MEEGAVWGDCRGLAGLRLGFCVPHPAKKKLVWREPRSCCRATALSSSVVASIQWVAL